MARFKKMTTDELVRIYECADKKMPNLAKHARNLNLMVLRGKVGEIYNRQFEMDSVKKILLRRAKANTLLTGPAGCGKTAIAEGLAWQLVNDRLKYMEAVHKEEVAWRRTAEKDEFGEYPTFTPSIDKPLFADTVIYDLSMNAMVSGCKYRGEFEEKLKDILREVKEHPNVVLFIDEIHQMGNIGGAEGTSNMAQIIKPALSRDEVRVIGATTTEESAIIKKDKALARRFSEVALKPLAGEAAVDCLSHILNDYAKFHELSMMDDVTAAGIMTKVNFSLPNTVFPDNAINVIDEAMASVKFEGRKVLENKDINAVLSRMSGTVTV